MVFTAFAVDVGAWYARANQLQRAADASALAGVVWMPDLPKATQVALDTARKNGFVNGGNITIAVAPVPGNAHRLQVTITDAKADQYFSQFIIDHEQIGRAAVAEFTTPVPLGSATNYFGTGNLNSGTPPAENVWAAVNGYCSAHENGDRRLSPWENAFTGSGYDCSAVNGTFQSPDYQSTGYLFAIDIGNNPPAGSIDVQVYDAAFQAGSSPNPDLALVGGAVIDTTFKLLDKGPPFSPLTHTVLQTTLAASGDASFQGWKSIGTIPTPKAGETYFVQVFTTAGQANSAGSNGFGVRAVVGGSFSACTTIAGSANPPFSSTCPQVHGYQEMSIFNNLSGSTATFFLAQIDPQYAGKTMKISLFDLGEGASKVEVLDPNGVPVNFDWSTPCNPPQAIATGCSATNVAALSPVDNATKPYTRTNSAWNYNDRSLTLTVQIPSNYTQTFGTKVWWKIRYTVGGAPTDRTTWSVDVLGSPVHLVS